MTVAIHPIHPVSDDRANKIRKTFLDCHEVAKPYSHA